MNELIEFLQKEGLLVDGADVKKIEDKATEYVESKVQEQTVGLINNRDRLKEEKIKIQQTLEELKTKYSFVEDNDLSSELFTDMKNQLETFRAKGDSDEEFEEKLKQNYERGKKAKLDELSPRLSTLEVDLKEAQKKAKDANRLFVDYKAEAEIRKAVNDAGLQVDSIWFNGLKQDAVIEVGDNGVMEISLPYEGGTLPIGDWTKSFPATTAGKRLLPASASKGGGAHGGASGDSGSSTSLAEQYSSMFKA